MSKLTRDGIAEPSRKKTKLSGANRDRNIFFSCSADHEQDWQPYPVDASLAICDGHTDIRKYIHRLGLLFMLP